MTTEQTEQQMEVVKIGQLSDGDRDLLAKAEAAIGRAEGVLAFVRSHLTAVYGLTNDHTVTPDGVITVMQVKPGKPEKKKAEAAG